MVIDMIPANRAMVKAQYPMPFLQTFGSYQAGSSVYFSLDAYKGYWQFPVEGDLEYQSFITPD
jgi:hypothetical protein